ncbi:DUF6944 family repetitive protein [Bacillus sp. 1P06AnD]|uniref:DUF6944 family repetitive protein n=1 Tax=Bacillus sp. 1P06AnD TaxID=3132208 RepID=UPI0039A3589D
MVIEETVTDSTTFALWIEAIGTILSAIGNTPSNIFSQSFLYNLDNIGDILQVTGTGIQIDDERVLSLNKLGNYIIAAGNLEEIAADFLLERESGLQQLLLNQGNAIQAAGTGLAVIYSFGQTPTLSNIYGLYANVLQLVGLALQVLAGGFPSDNETGTVINTIGNWVQASGAVLAVVSQELENADSSNESESSVNGEGKYNYSFYLQHSTA